LTFSISTHYIDRTASFTSSSQINPQKIASSEKARGDKPKIKTSLIITHAQEDATPRQVLTRSGLY
jgi:hypothetical protein